MSNDEVEPFFKHVEKLTDFYKSCFIVALAVRYEKSWLLLRAHIVLCGDFSPAPPTTPIPDEHFLLIHEIKPIAELDNIVSDLEAKGIIEVNGVEIEVFMGQWRNIFEVSPGTPSPTWSLEPLREHSSRFPWMNYRGNMITAKYSVTTIEYLFDYMDFNPNIILQSFGKHQYSGLNDFGQAIFGNSMSISNWVELSFIAPTWCSIENASISKDILEVDVACPSALHKSSTIFASARHPSDILIELKLAPLSEAIPKEVDGKTGFTQTFSILNVENLSSDIDYPFYVTLSHSSGTLLAGFRSLLPRRLDEADNPNSVLRGHFELAVQEAAKCKPEKKGKLHPKVGAVVVKNGQIVSQAHRGEIGRGDHAEFIALERKARGNPDVEGADLITTLEPCTTRDHDKRPCASWIKSRRIRKVWIATLDYNPSIAGRGEMELQKDGILIGRFPDDLGRRVLELNRNFLAEIESKQPRVSSEEQKAERSLMIEMLREKKVEEKDKFLGSWLDSALDMALVIEQDDAASWLKLGNHLAEAQQLGLSGLAYSLATKIDATLESAWLGKAHVELGMNTDMHPWPTEETLVQTPDYNVSNAWLQLVTKQENLLNRIMCLIRAMQTGFRDYIAWELLDKLLDETKRIPLLGDHFRIFQMFEYLAAILPSLDEDERSERCLRRAKEYETYWREKKRV
ncbi:MAG: hypothetical protein ACXADD_15035 [Candidatus Thorarchaeota archaeon]